MHMSNSELVARRNEITMSNIANKAAADVLKAKLKAEKKAKISRALLQRRNWKMKKKKNNKTMKKLKKLKS